MARRQPATASRQPARPKVDYIRDEVSRLIPAYFLIRDAIEGELAIKGIIGGGFTTGVAGAGNGGLPLVINNIVLSRAVRYLPQPNAEDVSPSNKERYRAYVTRAVWYGVTGRTLEGMAGQIFLRDPVVDIAPELDIMKDNADGSGLSLDQTSYRAVRHTLAYGRAGILVDYPVQNRPATAKAIADGEVQPTFTVYNPWDIINWRIKQIGSKKKLTLVVLREVIDEEGDDDFQLTQVERYRVLRLDDNGEHYVHVYNKDSIKPDQFLPTDASGKRLTDIPFHFIGSENNDYAPNRPPLYDLAALNIAHYRNSADYEEACFIAGQPTPVLSGLTEDWVKNILHDVVTLGSRAAIPLPVGATAELLQAQPNSMPMEGMKAKEEQMVALGAKLVQVQRSNRSATEQIIETTSESSTLANIAQNVSHAMMWALDIAARFVSTNPKPSKYTLNKDFDLTSMTADDQNAIIKQWQSGALTFPEMRSALRKAGIAIEEDVKAKAEIQADIKAGMIPDPAAVAGSMNQVPDAKGKSNAGGPQPKPIRRASKPANS
jgi:hypothetical protein